MGILGNCYNTTRGISLMIFIFLLPFYHFLRHIMCFNCPLLPNAFVLHGRPWWLLHFVMFNWKQIRLTWLFGEWILWTLSLHFKWEVLIFQTRQWNCIIPHGIMVTRLSVHPLVLLINTLRPRKKWQPFRIQYFEVNFLERKCMIKISLKLVPICVQLTICQHWFW